MQPLMETETIQIRAELAKRDEFDRILQPRFVLKDKNDTVRTEHYPMPLEPSARIAGPGFKDRANLQGELRKDAPTRSRLFQHVLFSLLACSPSWWLACGDSRAAFLKGDPYMNRELYVHDEHCCS